MKALKLIPRYNAEQTAMIYKIDVLSELTKMSAPVKKLFNATLKVVGKTEIYEDFTSKQWLTMKKVLADFDKVFTYAELKQHIDNVIEMDSAKEYLKRFKNKPAKVDTAITTGEISEKLLIAIGVMKFNGAVDTRNNSTNKAIQKATDYFINKA